MDSNFSKFKKRVWLYILIKCLLAGLATAVLAVNAVFIPCKLCGVKLFWLYYVLIGLGGLILGGGLALLLLRTNDKKIAKMLDKELCLQERVQTAYECQGETSDIFALQRANASKSLKSVSNAKSYKTLSVAVFFGSVASIVACVLCCLAIIAGTVAVPVIATYIPDPPLAGEEDNGTPVEPPREVTDWEWKALDDLINYVRASKKADVISKSGMVAELEGLRNVLLDGVSQSSLSTFVQNTATNIRNVVKDANDMDETTEEQKAFNTEEQEYVIKRLYEIFNITLPGGSGETTDPGDNEGDDNNNDDETTDPGETAKPGGLDVNDIPFYDPEKGYVKVGDSELLSTYYDWAQEAIANGTLSEEEWLDIIIAYYKNLS